MLSVNELHGKVLPYNDVNKIPNRNAFLDQNDYKEVDAKIAGKKELLFMPNDLEEMHLQDMEYKKSKYKIVLFGVLTDGRRATVVINGVYPYFEVPIPDNDENKAVGLYDTLKTMKYACPTSYELFKSREFEYQRDEILFVRFYFNKLKLRREAINYVRSKSYKTTNDDLSCYYRIVCRNRLTTFSSWVSIANYKVRIYKNIRGTVFSVNIGDYKKYEGDIMEDPKLSKDKLMTMCWDIETYSPDGRLPIPEIKEHRMFMIGLTFQWYHASNQLLRVCLVDHPCDPRPNYLTIVCENEKKLIKTFGKMIYKMKPEINLDFNGGDYDWPWLIKRAKSYPNTLSFLAECFDSTVHWNGYDDNNVFSYNFKHEKVKLEADTYADGYTLTFPGYINIDVRTMFRQLYPTAEKSSLNYFLKINNLMGKNDMPYQELFRAYRELNKLMEDPNLKSHYKNPLVSDVYKIKQELSAIWDEEIANVVAVYLPKTEQARLFDKMAEVADYCVVDSQRCHELMKKRSVIMDKREVANMSYTSVFDSFYRANGMKVRNLGIARGQQLNRRFSNISKTDCEEGKYPGAYVFPPIKGLVSPKLTIEERARLSKHSAQYKEWADVDEDTLCKYMNIIDEYGACPSDEDINKLQRVYALRKCFVDFLKEKIGRPITGLDFSSLYPSLMMAYNLSPECIITDKQQAKRAHAEGEDLHPIKFLFNGRVIKGWAVRHKNQIDPTKKNCKFGLFPMLLKELFDQRKDLKKILHKYEEQKEKLDALPEEELEARREKYEDVCFKFNYINSKQKALKLFMNTFYGESGNKRSPFFILQLAGAITTAGQKNIKMAQKYVEEKGCKTYYGDSVSGDTPLLLRDTDKKLLIKTIDDLTNNWHAYDQFKAGEPDRIHKQQGYTDLQIWSEGDWHDIKRVIRHKTNKKMFRVSTGIGCIDTTEDHSLLTDKREIIKPTELRKTTKLLHSFPLEYKAHVNDITPERAHFLGQTGAMWMEILNSCDDVRRAFYDGFSDNGERKTHTFATKIGAQFMYCLMVSIDIPVIVHEDDLFSLTVGYVKNPTAVKKVRQLSDATQENFVYDIETSKGSFLGGVGSLNVKNTDSIYISMPEKYFAEIDHAYYMGNMSKKDYCTKLVDITFEVIKPLNKEVNDMLKENNGTSFLKMAYEEALYPVAFLAKKKYYGIPHISIPNFKPKKLFIRGLEVKKRGVSELLRKVCMGIMWTSVDLNNTKTLMELVHDKIDFIYASKWDRADFIKTDVYKPTKQNVKVHVFVERMKARNITIKPYERFRYIVVKKNPYKYDLRGRKSKLSMGERMELAANYKEEIDLDYYMQGGVNGQLARLITYSDLFLHTPEDDSEEELKKSEAKIYANAYKYIENYCSKYYSNYNSKGKIYQKIFRMSNAVVVDQIRRYCSKDTAAVLNSDYVKNTTDEFIVWLEEKAEKAALKSLKNFGKTYVDNATAKLSKKDKAAAIKKMQNTYFAYDNSLSKMREQQFRDRKVALRRQISDGMYSIKKVMNFHTNTVEMLSAEIKKRLNIDAKYNGENEEVPEFDDISGDLDEDELRKMSINKLSDVLQSDEMITSLNKLQYVYVNLVCNYDFIHKTRMIVDYLRKYRNSSNNVVFRPASFDVEAFKKETLKSLLEDK